MVNPFALYDRHQSMENCCNEYIISIFILLFIMQNYNKFHSAKNFFICYYMVITIFTHDCN
jgi:hypothetical protein